MTDNLCKSLQAVSDERSSSIKQRFRLHVADAGFSGPVEWLHDEGHPNDLLASHARYFDILLMGQFSNPNEAQAKASGPNIVVHLERHGIDARRVNLSASRDGIGSTILDDCRKNDPDVLVMGAMGHARLREDLFGSLTRHILRNMTVPVMMAH
jgi:hypothetical protein